MSTSTSETTTAGRLGLFDAISIIVGIIIGATIYETPPLIFGLAGDPWIVLGLWAGAGFLAFIGALCYAELATTYPRLGGDYNYLSRAYGPLAGFLFGWGQLAVVQTASIGMMAYIFGHYTSELATRTQWWPNEGLELGELRVEPPLLYATAAIVVLTLLNMLGVVLGKTVQNLLSFVKVVGLGSIIFVGFYYAPAQEHDGVFGNLRSVESSKLAIKDKDGGEKSFQTNDKTKVKFRGKSSTADEEAMRSITNALESAKKDEKDIRLRVAFAKDSPGVATHIWTADLPSYATLAFPLVLIFLAYGGWNDAAFVAAEVRNHRRNIPLALLIGVILVSAIYVAVNAAYLRALGFEGVVWSGAVASDVLALLPQEYSVHGERIISILVMISALGAVNGLIFTSSRIYSTVGSDYSLLAPLSRWSALGAPIWAFLTSMVVSLAMLWLVDTAQGKQAIDTFFGHWLGIGTVSDWGRGGFEPLLKASAPVFWSFFLLTGLALFVLRINDPLTERPFSVPLYPIVPLLFVATCGYMLHSAIGYAGVLGLVGGGLVLLGLPLYVFSRRSIPEDAKPSAPSTPVLKTWR